MIFKNLESSHTSISFQNYKIDVDAIRVALDLLLRRQPALEWWLSTLILAAILALSSLAVRSKPVKGCLDSLSLTLSYFMIIHVGISKTDAIARTGTSLLWLLVVHYWTVGPHTNSANAGRLPAAVRSQGSTGPKVKSWEVQTILRSQQGPPFSECWSSNWALSYKIKYFTSYQLHKLFGRRWDRLISTLPPRMPRFSQIKA